MNRVRTWITATACGVIGFTVAHVMFIDSVSFDLLDLVAVGFIAVIAGLNELLVEWAGILSGWLWPYASGEKDVHDGLRLVKR